MKPYVYKCIHKVTGEFYFGYRSQNKMDAELDLGHVYFTSSKIVKPIFDQFDYTILARFDTKFEAHTFEQSMIKEHWDDPLLLNRAMFPRIKHHGSQKQSAIVRERMLTNNPMKSPEARERQRQRMLGTKQSDATKAKRSKSMKGKILPKRPGSQLGAKNRGAKTYKFISPEGEEFIVTGGFYHFCMANKLGHNSCINVAKGRRSDYHGWKIHLVI